MTTPPAVYGQFGRALAFAERTLTESLRRRLAERSTAPEVWYALSLVATTPGMERTALRDTLDRSPSLDSPSADDLLARLEADGLLRGGEHTELTEKGDELYRCLKEYIAGPTFELLSQFDLADIETTVRTIQAITAHAEQDAASTSR